MAPLAREIEFSRAYLEIERVRFADRLQWNLPSETSVEGIRVPSLTLQPLVENAVRHGISKRINGGGISVRVDRNGDRFSLVVENAADISSVADSPFFKPGHALHNIRERLRLIYGGQASIKVSVPKPDLVTVTIEAPDEPTPK